MTEVMWNRTLVALWAVTLALLTSQAFGLTHVFSSLFGEKHVTITADIAFLLLSVIYAALLSRFAPRACSCLFKMAALLLPCLILWFLLF